MSVETEKVDLETPDLAAAKRAAFEELFPGVLADGVLDATRLGELLDTEVTAPTDGRERFGLMWAGKHDAVRSLLTPSRGTLLPEPDKSIDFDSAQHVFIEGDNLEVLKLLQKAYNDRVKLIYVDPPYNTGKGDFVYADNFADGMRRYLEYTGQLDDSGNRVTAVSESAGRLHSKWLTMLYPRLLLARNLLRQDGLLFISIDDNEVATLRLILDEIFGQENFLATLVWDRGHSQQQGQFKEYHEYVLAYARDRARLVGFKDPAGGEVLAGAIKKPSKANPRSEFRFPAGVPVEAPEGTEFTGEWGNAEATSLVDGRFLVKDGVTAESVTLSAAWTQKGQMQAFFYGDGDVVDTRGQRVLSFFFSSTGKLKYRKERTAMTPSTVQRWGTQGAASGALAEFMGAAVFDLPKPVAMVKDFVAWATEADDVVLDFFAGSGTTGHAVAQQNAEDGGRRHCVSVNLPQATDATSAAYAAGFEKVSDITLARLRAVAVAEEGAAAAGLRVYRLEGSNFRQAGDAVELFDLNPATLATADADPHAVAAEVLLKEGVPLDARWNYYEIAGAEVIAAGGVAVVLSTEITDEVVADALALGARVVVFLEDGFAGADAVKANAVTNARNLGITLKTV